MLTLGWCRRYGHSTCHQKDASDDGEPSQGPSHEDRCRHHRWKVGQLHIHHTGGRLRQTGLGFSAFYPVQYLGQVSMLGFYTVYPAPYLKRSLYWGSIQLTLFPYLRLVSVLEFYTVYPVPYLGQVSMLRFSTFYRFVPSTGLHTGVLYSLPCSVPWTGLHTGVLYGLPSSVPWTGLYTGVLYSLPCSVP